MSGRLTLLVIYLCFMLKAAGQLRDTSLLVMYTRPFFYNLVKDWQGSVFAGTSDGIYRLEGVKTIKTGTQTGYLKIDEKGKVVIDSNGIQYYEQTSMLHLLPFPADKRNEYHAGSDKYFYITSGGRIHIYEILPYAYQFKNHSIRTISTNFTGTYSGIYYKDKHLKAPVSPFSDGYIREYNGKVFMCSHDLDVYEANDIAFGKTPTRLNLPAGYNFIPARDIKYSQNTKRYILSSGNRLAILDSSLQNVQEIFKSPTNEEIVLLDEISEYNLFFFATGNTLYLLELANNNLRKITQIPGAIKDGITKHRNQYLILSNGLYFDQGKGKFEKKIDLKKAHTIREISENEFAIGTDEGLFLYKQNENKLHILIPGVEFNRRALLVDENKLYAGSINGLYILDLTEIDNIIALANNLITSSGNAGIPTWFILLSVTIVSIFSIMLFQYKRRIQKMEAVIEETENSEQKPNLSRADIETFIQESLSTASLKSIVSHFDTNTSMVYTLLAPSRPGDLIQQLRYQKVKELRAAGKTAKEIATVTGLSDSYVRKIWNNF